MFHGEEGEKISHAKLQEDYCLSIGTIAERFFFFFPVIQVSFSLFFVCKRD